MSLSTVCSAESKSPLTAPHRSSSFFSPPSRSFRKVFGPIRTSADCTLIACPACSTYSHPGRRPRKSRFQWFDFMDIQILPPPPLARLREGRVFSAFNFPALKCIRNFRAVPSLARGKSGRKEKGSGFLKAPPVSCGLALSFRARMPVGGPIAEFQNQPAIWGGALSEHSLWSFCSCIHVFEHPEFCSGSPLLNVGHLETWLRLPTASKPLEFLGALPLRWWQSQPFGSHTINRPARTLCTPELRVFLLKPFFYPPNHCSTVSPPIA